MKMLDTVLIAIVSIVLFVVFNKLNQKRKTKKTLFNSNKERCFNLKCEDDNYEASCTVKGGDTLLGVMEEFSKEVGLGIEFKITEISPEEFNNIEPDAKSQPEVVQ